jgi:hypothetical protein
MIHLFGANSPVFGTMALASDSKADEIIHRFNYAASNNELPTSQNDFDVLISGINDLMPCDKNRVLNSVETIYRSKGYNVKFN